MTAWTLCKHSATQQPEHSANTMQNSVLSTVQMQCSVLSTVQMQCNATAWMQYDSLNTVPLQCNTVAWIQYDSLNTVPLQCNTVAWMPHSAVLHFRWPQNKAKAPHRVLFVLKRTLQYPTVYFIIFLDSKAGVLYVCTSPICRRTRVWWWRQYGEWLQCWKMTLMIGTMLSR